MTGIDGGGALLFLKNSLFIVAMEGGMSGDYRHMSSGSLSIPTGLGPQNGTSNGQPQNMTAMAAGPRFDGPRSPPGKQSEYTRLPFGRERENFADCVSAQIRRMFLASSSDKVPVKPAKPVRSAMI